MTLAANIAAGLWGLRGLVLVHVRLRVSPAFGKRWNSHRHPNPRVQDRSRSIMDLAPEAHQVRTDHPAPVDHRVPYNARAIGGPFDVRAPSARLPAESPARTGSAPSIRTAACGLAIAIRGQIESVRSCAIAAIDDIAACAESSPLLSSAGKADSGLVHDLVDYVHHLSADKVAALECEAVTVDAALEKLDAASDAMSRSAALATLHGLPSGPIELDIIALSPGIFRPLEALTSSAGFLPLRAYQPAGFARRAFTAVCCLGSLLSSSSGFPRHTTAANTP